MLGNGAELLPWWKNGRDTDKQECRKIHYFTPERISTVFVCLNYMSFRTKIFILHLHVFQPSSSV